MTMQVESEQLGPLEIPEEAVIHFTHGIPGFPATKDFCLVEVKPGSRFKLLQSITRADLAFVVTDPMEVDADYPMDKVHEIAQDLGLDEGEPLAIASIVSVQPPPSPPTANLMAPLVMGLQSRVGVQVVLHNSPYGVRHEM